MTTELQQGRYDAIMRRVGDLKGPGSKVAEVLAELFPVIDLERVPGELLILGGTDICSGQTSLIGAVGQRSNIQLFNPTDSSKIITVTQFIANTDATQDISWGTAPIALTTLINSQLFRDTRRPFNSLPSGQIRSQSIAAGPVTFAVASLIGNTAFRFSDENEVAVLSPGFGLTIAAAVNNSQLLVTFYWRERVVEPSELVV